MNDRDAITKERIKVLYDLSTWPQCQGKELREALDALTSLQAEREEQDERIAVHRGLIRDLTNTLRNKNLKNSALQAENDELNRLADKMGSGWALVEYQELEAKNKKLVNIIKSIKPCAGNKCVYAERALAKMSRGL